MNSGHHAQPEIESNIEVASIEIQAGASLTIGEKGEVLIDGEYNFTEGIVNYGGSIINDGIISLFNVDGFTSEKFLEVIKGKGIAYLDGLSIDEAYFAKK